MTRPSPVYSHRHAVVDRWRCDRMENAQDQPKFNPSRRLRAVNFLSRASKEYLELSSEDDLFVYLARKLTELTGQGAVAVSSFQKETHRFCLRCMIQSLGDRDKPMHRDSDGLFFEAGESLMSLLMSGKLTKVMRRGPAALPAAFMKKVLSLEQSHEALSLYAIGFGWRSEILGNAVIMVPKGKRIKNKTLVSWSSMPLPAFTKWIS